MAQISKVRTPAELQNPELNYFIAFKISYKETDLNKIKELITKKRNTFASNQTNINNRLVELKQDIDKIMLEDAIYDNQTCEYVVNSGGRQQEAKRAEDFSFKKAEAAITAICGRGYVYDHELDLIAQKNDIDAKELYDRVKYLFDKVKYKETKAIKREVSFANLKKLEDLLNTVQKKNVYDFLGLESNASVSEITQKRALIYSDASKKGKNAQATAAISICGIIDIIFKTPASRREYDIFYRCKEQVWDKLKMFKEAGIKDINDKMITELSDVIKQTTGISVDEVETELDAYLKNFDLIRDSSHTVLDLETCPYEDCGKSYVVEPNLKVCPNCGKPLEIVCWNCKKITPYTYKQKTCTNCGVNKNSEAQFNLLLNSFHILINKKNVTDVELNQTVNKMENILPGYEKHQDSYIFKKILDAKKEIKAKEIELANAKIIYDKYIKEINIFINKKEYFKAQQLLNKLKMENAIYDVKDLEKSINDPITIAQQYFDKAQQYAKIKDEVRTVEFAVKALEICSDFAIAQQILKNFPPHSPTNLVAKAIKNAVKLEWNVSSNQNSITYTIIRKVGSQPVNDEDGMVIASDLTINFFEDTSISPAVSYYYAVFATRGGIRSKITTTTSPINIYLDVNNVTQAIVENAIKVKWIVPDNVKCVEVYKKEGSIQPLSPNEGVKLNNVTLGGFEDNDLKEDTNSYLIRCGYLVDKQIYYSPGIKYTYKKLNIPRPITNINLNAIDKTEFELTFDNIINGTLKLYISSKHIELNYNTVSTYNDFKNRIKSLNEIEYIIISNTKINFTAQENKLSWLYVVNANNDLCVISEPLVVNTIMGITNINVVEKNDTIVIEGNIDSNTRNIIAKISNEKFPTSIDEKCDQIICSKEMFIRDKGFIIRLNSELHYITLFSEFMDGGKKIYSRPVKLPAPVGKLKKSIVQFSITYDVSTKKPYNACITLYAEEPLQLPELLLVKGFPKPFSKNGGIKVQEIESMPLKSKLFKKGYWAKTSITIETSNNSREKLSLFVNDDFNKTIQLKEVKKL